MLQGRNAVRSRPVMPWRFRLNSDQATHRFSNTTGRACWAGISRRVTLDRHGWRPCGTPSTSGHLLMETHPGESEPEHASERKELTIGKARGKAPRAPQQPCVQWRSATSHSLQRPADGWWQGSVARAGYHEPHAATAARHASTGYWLRVGCAGAARLARRSRGGSCGGRNDRWLQSATWEGEYKTRSEFAPSSCV
jgi:hypothetical protein